MMRSSNSKPNQAGPRKWTDKPRLVLALGLVIFLAMVAANESPRYWPSALAMVATSAPLSAQVTATNTPFPAELTDPNQTNGLIIGGIILVLIIVGGTLGVIRRKTFE